MQGFYSHIEQKENFINYILCHNMNECQLTYETNGSYYAQNAECHHSHHH